MLGGIVWARWLSGRAFDCKSSSHWFESLHWPNVNLSSHEKLISQAPLDQGVNKYPEKDVSMHVRYSWAPYIGWTQNRERNSSPERPER